MPQASHVASGIAQHCGPKEDRCSGRKSWMGAACGFY